MGYVYFIKAEESNSYKIGITKNSPEKRLKTLQTGNSEKLTLVETYKSEHYRKIETQLHRNLKEYRLEGEWFMLDETFNFTEKCNQVEDLVISLLDNPFY